MKWYQYDPVEGLDSEEVIAAYLQEAYDIGDPEFIELALATAQKARQRYHLSGGSSRLTQRGDGLGYHLGVAAQL